MTYANPDALVSTEWLAGRLDSSDVRVVDASYHLPGTGRDARDEHEEQHIPGAVFFDIDAIADADSDLPHMLPDAKKFESMVSELGLGDGQRIVVYDSLGCVGAARVWWTLRVFGHNDAAVLDGGLPKWLAEKRPTESWATSPEPCKLIVRKDDRLVRGREEILANIKSYAEQVVDARSAGRFDGSEPEPRKGMRGGHIPGSLNLPFNFLFDKDQTFRSNDDLKMTFMQAGVDLGRPIVTTCGSGVTASVLALGLYLIGRKDVAVYDGSWSEWGSREDTPIET